MAEEIAYCNGEFIPASKLSVRPQDTGFMLGVTVAEQLRTFGGKLFALEEHIHRLRSSLSIIGIDSVELSQLESAARQVAAHNHALLSNGDDLGVAIYVTPGIYPTYRQSEDTQPNIGIHSYPLPFHWWAEKYVSGQRCRFVPTRQVSKACWPRSLKCRSRMHYYLADREASLADPGSRAVLLDEAGRVNEASTANVLAFFADRGLVSPPREDILDGVSLRTCESLAARLSLAFHDALLSPEDLRQADEILLTSTPFCVLPVSHLQGQAFPRREVFQRLMHAWSEQVGIDIVAQARRFADR